MMNETRSNPIDLQAMRRSLQGESGPRYWRSLEQLANTAAFRAMVADEFGPHGIYGHDRDGLNHATGANGLSRRDFLTLAAASLALAGLTGCDQPREGIVPYVRRPEDIVPGQSLYFATAMPFDGAGVGVLVRSHMGRPLKIEGHPDHPSSLGATDPFAQAAILSLYDPDRAQVILHQGRISTWSVFLEDMRTRMEVFSQNGGRGLRILSEPILSPTLAGQRRDLLERFPEAGWHQFTPVPRDAVRAGAIMAFGRDVHARHDLSRARVILSLDADFLINGPGHLRYARQFSDGRRVHNGAADMNRLYAVACTPTLTAAMADHCFTVNPPQVQSIALALARRLTGHGDTGGVAPAWLEPVVEDLRRHKGEAVVIVGDYQPPEVHALGHMINNAIDAFGRTVEFTEPIAAAPVDQVNSLEALTQAMERGEVDTLLVLGGNPVYDAPADLRFAEHFERVPMRLHVGSYDDETARLCQWHIPEAHFLESWSDTRAYDGTISIMQPLIAPLYAGRSQHEVLAVLLDDDRSGEEIVRGHYEALHGSESFAAFWRRSLHDGVMAGTSYQSVSVTLRPELDRLLDVVPDQRRDGDLHLIIRPDPTVWDGRFANNGWLQELPKPITKLTWDNAALIAPAMAQRLDLQNGDVVEFEFMGRSARGPVWIVPGHPDQCVTMHLGHGRERAGRVGTGVGFDVYRLRDSAALWGGGGLLLRKTEERRELACTQDHHSMEGRHHVRAATLREFQEHPEIIHESEHHADVHLSLYPERRSDEGHAWGMVIDLNTCIGCNSCVIACQAENNIPVVGAEEVRKGREMHWIRVDRYYAGGLDHPETLFQPVPCMHCENAPCEVVCPVAATVHSHEGLNEMVYNRCVGTRYCSNNCPYKVRRFNFFPYADFETPSLKLLYNPDVTVRSRGVMEKCTYCVQRINAARIASKKSGQPIQDGDLATACQAVCPTQAIIFGDLNDPQSHVARLQRAPHRYALLEELNVRPRTTYLAKLTNPNPAVGPEPRHD